MGEHIFQVEVLKKFIEDVFEKVGVTKENSEVLSRSLAQADLEGMSSHGVSKLPIYVKRIMEERINNNPDIKSEKIAPGILLIDGDNGPGAVVANHAIHTASSIVKEVGIVAVGVRNSNHFGAASFFCQEACTHGMISMVFTNAPPGVAPWGTKEPYFGTNPLAFGFPNGTKTPIIIDMSSSVVARGKIRMAAKKGEEIPWDWALDKNGIKTTDAKEALEGAILPMGGAKGSALALMVEIFSGLLTKAAFGKDVQSFNNDDHDKANVGHFLVLIDVTKFMDLSVFESLLQTMIQEIKELPKAEGVKEVLIPGERRERDRIRRQKEGITVTSSVLDELKELGNRVGVPF